jgi:hypothetical protein
MTTRTPEAGVELGRAVSREDREIHVGRFTGRRGTPVEGVQVAVKEHQAQIIDDVSRSGHDTRHDRAIAAHDQWPPARAERCTHGGPQRAAGALQIPEADNSRGAVTLRRSDTGRQHRGPDGVDAI